MLPRGPAGENVRVAEVRGGTSRIPATVAGASGVIRRAGRRSNFAVTPRGGIPARLRERPSAALFLLGVVSGVEVARTYRGVSQVQRNSAREGGDIYTGGGGVWEGVCPRTPAQHRSTGVLVGRSPFTWGKRSSIWLTDSVCIKTTWIAAVPRYGLSP